MWPGSSIPATACTAEPTVAPKLCRLQADRFSLRPRETEKLSLQEMNIRKTFPKFLCLTAADKNLAGFNRDFRFTGQKHICAAAKKKRRADVNTENPRIRKKRL